MELKELIGYATEHSTGTLIILYLIYAAEKHIWPSLKEAIKVFSDISRNLVALKEKLDSLTNDVKSKLGGNDFR